MPIVLDSMLKGNYGASLVMARLSGECLVRPVAAGTDVGIDLYCETVADGKPFLHFWMQVKAGGQCSVVEGTHHASCSFQIDHLRYWAQQPVPVFAALVPTHWPVSSEPDLYIVDITTQMLLSQPDAGQKSITLMSDLYWPHGSYKELKEFLTTTIPDTTARLQISKGILSPSPTLQP